jgi:hypothetical protein
MMTQWQYRILKALGIANVFGTEAKKTLSGYSKHGRQRKPRRDWREHRKKRRQMARASRRINRQ